MIEPCPGALSQRHEASQYQQQHQQRPNSGGSHKSPCPRNDVRYTHYPYSMSRSSTPCSQGLGSTSSTPTLVHPKIRNTLYALSHDNPTPQLTPASSSSPMTNLGDDCLGDDFGNVDQRVQIEHYIFAPNDFSNVDQRVHTEHYIFVPNDLSNANQIVHIQHHMLVPRVTREGEGNGYSPHHASTFSTPHRAQHSNTAALSMNAQPCPSPPQQGGHAHTTSTFMHPFSAGGGSSFEQWPADSSLNEDDVTMNRRVLTSVASPIPEKPTVAQLPQVKPHELANGGSLADGTAESEVRERSTPHDDQDYGLSKSRNARSSSVASPSSPHSIDIAGCPALLNRCRQRERQIQLGKATLGYINYRETVPIERRQPDDPVTPRAASERSKRDFDKLLGEWRRTLHRYDPTMTSDEKPTNETGVHASIWSTVDDARGDKGGRQSNGRR